MSPWPYPKLIAHRGAGKYAPENTLVAMRAGAHFGYRMVEFDVKLSADNVLFLLHDDTLERTSNGTGNAAQTTWHALSQLDAGAWHSAAFAGEPFPTFASIVAFCRANAVAMNVEIKPCPGRERETGEAVARAVLAWYGTAQEVPILSSFSEQALEAAGEAAPSLPRALLLDKLPTDWLERCQRLGCVALDTNWRELSAAVVQRAHSHGLAVLCYTCNEPEAVRELVEWGVDGIITDAVALIAP
jgi:glycerophosphoryl diester phosphodiesterase